MQLSITALNGYTVYFTESDWNRAVELYRQFDYDQAKARAAAL